MKYNKFLSKIKINQEFFEKILDKISNTKNIELKLLLSQLALNFATFNNTGYFISSFLEKVYTDYAKTIDIDNYNIEYEKNSFLHVITEGYNTGGHTRVVERWIKNSHENQKHSVVVLNPNKQKLTNLEYIIKEKNGDIFYFNRRDSLKEKALLLRQIGLKHQYIVLHIHMQDPTAVVAFGTNKFTRPVLFYNHASHMFWIGKSVSDIVLDVIMNDKITTENKKIKNNFFLGLSISDIKLKTINKLVLRKKLDLPVDKKIIISAGSDHKYNPIGDDNFVELVLKIIDKDTYLYIVGADRKRDFWKSAYKKSNGHINALGYIDFEKGYLDYIRAADLYIDSYPCNGGTAIIDAISLGIPSLMLATAFPSFSFIDKTKAYCFYKNDFIDKAKKILNDKNYAKDIINELKFALLNNYSKEAWTKRVEKLLTLIPNKHDTKDLSKEIDYKEIDDLCVLNNISTNKNFLKYSDFFYKKYLKYVFIIRYCIFFIKQIKLKIVK